MVFESVLDPIFRPILALPPLLGMVIISFIISLIITISYKYMTDQTKMKELKTELKELQKKVKEFKHDANLMMQHQKQAMSKNFEYMKHSMKPTLITFLPIIIIFGWLNANFAFEPIMPGADFTTTATFKAGTTGQVELIVPPGIIMSDGQALEEIKENIARWRLNGKEGEYVLEYKFQGEIYHKELLITKERKYKKPIEKIDSSPLIEIAIDNEPLRPMGNFSLFGWYPGWIATYLIFSLVFSTALRKIMGLH